MSAFNPPQSSSMGFVRWYVTFRQALQQNLTLVTVKLLRSPVFGWLEDVQALFCCVLQLQVQQKINSKTCCFFFFFVVTQPDFTRMRSCGAVLLLGRLSERESLQFYATIVTLLMQVMVITVRVCQCLLTIIMIMIHFVCRVRLMALCVSRSPDHKINKNTTTKTLQKTSYITKSKSIIIKKKSFI